jgi:hypothetical protein
MDAWNFSAVFHKFSWYIPRFNAEILLETLFQVVHHSAAATLRTYLLLVTIYGAVEIDCEIKLTAQQLWNKCFAARQTMYV